MIKLHLKAAHLQTLFLLLMMLVLLAVACNDLGQLPITKLLSVAKTKEKRNKKNLVGIKKKQLLR